MWRPRHKIICVHPCVHPETTPKLQPHKTILPKPHLNPYHIETCRHPHQTQYKNHNHTKTTHLNSYSKSNNHHKTILYNTSVTPLGYMYVMPLIPIPLINSWLYRYICQNKRCDTQDQVSMQIRLSIAYTCMVQTRYSVHFFVVCIIYVCIFVSEFKNSLPLFFPLLLLSV